METKYKMAAEERDSKDELQTVMKNCKLIMINSLDWGYSWFICTL